MALQEYMRVGHSFEYSLFDDKDNCCKKKESKGNEVATSQLAARDPEFTRCGMSQRRRMAS